MKKFFSCTLFFGLASLIGHGSAIAQIAPDGSIPTSVTSPDGLNFTIDNGAVSGHNLFHSFREFSVPTNGSVFFNNAANVQNIFSRITGGNISHIDGLIRANGGANLFLLNPAGIMFGPNTQLNIGGSFFGSTAQSVQFADGVEFSAQNPQAAPLLTVSVPVGLQFGQNPGGITVQGSGHRLAGNLFTPSDRSQNPSGLQVGADNTLALIGGAVNFIGGIVAVDGGGHLEVGSVSEGQVGLNATPTGWVGDYSAVKQFNDIHLAQQSLLDASGSNGSIQIQGRNISLSDGSAALIHNLGSQSSGGITVNATDALNFMGNTSDGGLGSFLQIDNLGTGQAGDITVSAAQLSFQDGGLINTRMFDQGAGGNITVKVVGLLTLDGVVPGNPVIQSSIETYTFNAANSGNVTVSASNLRVLNSGSVNSLSIGSGQTGTVRVNVEDLIEIVGNNPITLAPSVLGLAAFSSGNSNSIFVNTSRLVIREGGIIGSGAFLTGAAGNVTVNASEFIDISGRGAGSILPSRIVSTAEILDPVLQAAYGLPPIPSGNAGSLTINTPSLRIADGALVTVKNDGPGSAGDMQINSHSIFLGNQGSITASTASGNGGNIRLNLQQPLLLRHNSLISANAAGNGNGGNLSINAPVLVALENSDIIANAILGNGGNIQITTEGIFLSPDSDITASSQLGISGTVSISNLNLHAQNLVVLPTNTFVNQAPVIASSCLNQRNAQQGRFVVTGNGGLPETPDHTLMLYEVASVRDVGQIQAIDLRSPETTNSRQLDRPIQEATGLAFTPDGKVALVVAKGEMASPTELTCSN